MPAITLIVTNAGRALLPSNGGIAAVHLTQLGLSAAAVAPNAALTAIAGEFKRINTVSGTVTSADTLSLAVLDESADTYDARSFGVYASDGTLFAVYGQATPFVEKAAESNIALTVDIKFADIDVNALAFGATNFLLPTATQTVQGLVELATDAETAAKTDAVRAVTPKSLWFAFSTWLSAAVSDVWRSSNDGSGSGLDADMIDGLHATAFARTDTDANPAWRARGVVLSDPAIGLGGLWVNDTQGLYVARNGGGVRIWDAGNDGSGSGLDADLLDGADSSWFADIPARLGYTPVQQGGGAGQAGNKLYIGWGYNSRVRVQVDGSDMGNVVFDGHISDVWRSSNDGAGSGLDADMLDGLHASQFVQGANGASQGIQVAGDNATDDIWSGALQIREIGYSGAGDLATARAPTITFHWSGQTAAAIKMYADGSFRFRSQSTDPNSYRDVYAGTFYSYNQTVWSAGNDGSGSGLDADVLDGQDSSFYTDIPSRLGFYPVQQGGGAYQFGTKIYIGWDGARLRSQVEGLDLGPVVFDSNISNVWRASNDGSGSGLDADVLDGQDSGYYTDIVGRLGYSPIQQGGGAGQAGNKIYIGWDGGRLKAQIEGLDLGPLVFDDRIGDVWRASNDGSGSTLDADMLDGRHASDFALASDFSDHNLDSTGYQVFPGGVIHNWALVMCNGDNTVNVVWAKPFTTKCFIVSVTAQNSGVNISNYGAVISYDRFGATVARIFSGGNNQNNYMHVIAYGR